MINLTPPFFRVMFGTLFIAISCVSAQNVFGQKAKSSTLAPAEQSVEIKYDDLPAPLLKVLNTDKYAGLEVEKIYKVGKRKATREDHYTIRFKTGNNFTDVYLDADGNVIDPQDSDNE